MPALKAKIYRNPDPFVAPYHWFYAVDYTNPDGSRDLDSASFDYGSVESHAFAVECVTDAFARYARGETS